MHRATLLSFEYAKLALVYSYYCRGYCESEYGSSIIDALGTIFQLISCVVYVVV